MTRPISATIIHHLTITVSDVARSQAFYEQVLGFQKAADFGDRAVLHNGHTMLVIGPPPDSAQAIANDAFDENRIGLDHLSFSVADRAELTHAIALLDAHGIEHGEIKDLAGFGISVLAFRDPDNVQLELTTPFSAE